MLYKLARAFLLAILFQGAGPALAWPEKPIQIIVPFPAGGSGDLISRPLAVHLGKVLGQPVVIINSGGAMGSIGLAQLMRAQPDGYTIGISSYTSQVVNPLVQPVPFDPVKSFTPIGGIVRFHYVLVANPSEPYKTVQELVKWSRQTSGGLPYGSGGSGGGSHLIADMLRAKTNAMFLHVPYKGNTPALNDVVAGNVKFMFEVEGPTLPLIQSGRLMAMATTGKKRSARLPNVPTVAESVPGFEASGWFAFFGPRGLPPEITDRLNAEINKLYSTPAFKEYLAKYGFEPEVGSPAQVADLVQRDLQMWNEVLTSAGVK